MFDSTHKIFLNAMTRPHSFELLILKESQWNFCKLSFHSEIYLKKCVIKIIFQIKKVEPNFLQVSTT